VNTLGVKGIGEAGTIAATPAVASAVLDAIKPLGVTELDMPLTPMRVWQAIHGNGPRATEQGRSLDEQGEGSAGSGPAKPPEGGAA
jgi:carbon-monoxide dehydrogenase large subunit